MLVNAPVKDSCSIVQSLRLIWHTAKDFSTDVRTYTCVCVAWLCASTTAGYMVKFAVKTLLNSIVPSENSGFSLLFAIVKVTFSISPKMEMYNYISQLVLKQLKYTRVTPNVVKWLSFMIIITIYCFAFPLTSAEKTKSAFSYSVF